MIQFYTIRLKTKPHLIKLLRLPNLKQLNIMMDSNEKNIYKDYVTLVKEPQYGLYFIREKHLEIITYFFEFLLTRDSDFFLMVRLLRENRLNISYKLIKEPNNYEVKLKFHNDISTKHTLKLIEAIQENKKHGIRLIKKGLENNFYRLALLFVFVYHFIKRYSIKTAIEKYIAYLDLAHSEIKLNTLIRNLHRKGLTNCTELMNNYWNCLIYVDYNINNMSYRQIGMKYQFSKNTVSKICNDKKVKEYYTNYAYGNWENRMYNTILSFCLP